MLRFWLNFLNRNVFCSQFCFLRVIFLCLFIFSFVSCVSFYAQKGKKEVLDYYFADKYGNKIDKYGVNGEEFIYVILVTKNLIGEDAILEIESGDGNCFLYNGKYIDKEIRFKIRRNTQKLKLYIYDSTNRWHRELKERAVRAKAEKEVSVENLKIRGKRKSP